MSHMYHLSVCLPYDKKNPIEMISKKKGFSFVNLPTKILGNSQYVHVRKLIWVLGFLNANEIADDSLIMFTDAHDVLLLADAGEMHAKFLRQDCDLLFSAEKLFSPHSDDAQPYRFDVKRSFEIHEGDHAAYPNSGCWIGWGWAAKAFLRQVVAYARERGDDDDQRVVQDVLYQNNYGDLRIKLDVQQQVFVSVIANGDDIRLVGNKIFYRDRPDSIGVFHANGYKKALDFLVLYSNLFYMIDNDLVDLRSIRQDDGYLCFQDGRFWVSERYNVHSLLAVVKAGRRCCLVTNQGAILSFNPDSGAVFESRSVADFWEIIELQGLNSTLQRHLDRSANVSLSYLCLNDIWGFLRAGIHDDLIKYFYNL